MVDAVGAPGASSGGINTNQQAQAYINNVFNRIGANDIQSRQRFSGFIFRIINELNNPQHNNPNQVINTLRNNGVLNNDGILGFVEPNQRATFTNHLEGLIRAYVNNPNNPQIRQNITNGLVNATLAQPLLQAFSNSYGQLNPQQRQQVNGLISVLANNGVGASNQWNNHIAQIDRVSPSLGEALRELSSAAGVDRNSVENRFISNWLNNALNRN